MDNFVKIMKALSDPNRVKILKMLQQRIICVCEIQSLLSIAQPTVSKHLKILDEAGLVKRHKDGLWVNYQIFYGNPNPYAASLLGQLRHWLSDDPDVKAILDHLPDINREDIVNKR